MSDKSRPQHHGLIPEDKLDHVERQLQSALSRIQNLEQTVAEQERRNAHLHVQLMQARDDGKLSLHERNLYPTGGSKRGGRLPKMESKKFLRVLMVVVVVIMAAVGSTREIATLSTTTMGAKLLFASPTNTTATATTTPPRIPRLAQEQQAVAVYPSDPEVATLAVDPFHRLGHGFFNQQMAFLALIMRVVDLANSTGRPYQLLLPTLDFRDYLGSNQSVPLHQLFDVDHWNTHFPELPRLVSYNHSQHYQYNVTTQSMVVDQHKDYTHPQHLDGTHKCFEKYLYYYQQMESGKRSTLHPTDRLLMTGALRPAPPMQAAIDSFVPKNHNYLALHLRIEPDFLCHQWPSRKRKQSLARNLTQVVQLIESRLNPPPEMNRCYIAVNRPVLEDGTKIRADALPSVAACDAERRANLEALNKLVQTGLWGGRVTVLERPAQLMIGSQPLSTYPSAWGALLDSEICEQAAIFVGTGGSTFTLQIVRHRIAMDKADNYNYERGMLYKMSGEPVPKSIAQ